MSWEFFLPFCAIPWILDCAEYILIVVISVCFCVIPCILNGENKDFLSDDYGDDNDNNDDNN